MEYCSGHKGESGSGHYKQADFIHTGMFMSKCGFQVHVFWGKKGGVAWFIWTGSDLWEIHSPHQNSKQFENFLTVLSLRPHLMKAEATWKSLSNRKQSTNQLPASVPSLNQVDRAISNKNASLYLRASVCRFNQSWLGRVCLFWRCTDILFVVILVW